MIKLLLVLFAVGICASDVKNYSVTNLNVVQSQSYEYMLNFSFDRIDAIGWMITANQTNYSYSLFCYYDTNITFTMNRFTCGIVCGNNASMIEEDVFINYCELYTWYRDYYPGEMETPFMFNITVDVEYEGFERPYPFGPESPTVTPEPNPVPVFSPGEIAGIVIACAAVAVAVVAASVFGYRRYVNDRTARN